MSVIHCLIKQRLRPVLSTLCVKIRIYLNILVKVIAMLYWVNYISIFDNIMVCLQYFKSTLYIIIHSNLILSNSLILSNKHSRIETNFSVLYMQYNTECYILMIHTWFNYHFNLFIGLELVILYGNRSNMASYVFILLYIQH